MYLVLMINWYLRIRAREEIRLVAKLRIEELYCIRPWWCSGRLSFDACSSPSTMSDHQSVVDVSKHLPSLFEVRSLEQKWSSNRVKRLIVDSLKEQFCLSCRLDLMFCLTIQLSVTMRHFKQCRTTQGSCEKSFTTNLFVRLIVYILLQ